MIVFRTTQPESPQKCSPRSFFFRRDGVQSRNLVQLRDSPGNVMTKWFLLFLVVSMAAILSCAGACRARNDRRSHIQAIFADTIGNLHRLLPREGCACFIEKEGLDLEENLELSRRAPMQSGAACPRLHAWSALAKKGRTLGARGIRFAALDKMRVRKSGFLPGESFLTMTGC